VAEQRALETQQRLKESVAQEAAAPRPAPPRIADLPADGPDRPLQAGDRVLVSYTVGDTEVLEMPGLAATSPTPVFSRAFNVGPRRRDLVLQVAHGAGGQAALHVRRLPGEPPRLVAVFPAEGAAGTGARAVAGRGAQRQLVVGVWNVPPGARWLADGSNVRLPLPAGPR